MTQRDLFERLTSGVEAVVNGRRFDGSADDSILDICFSDEDETYEMFYDYEVFCEALAEVYGEIVSIELI